MARNSDVSKSKELDKRISERISMANRPINETVDSVDSSVHMVGGVQIYDPRPKDNDDTTSKAIVWSTQSVEWALEMTLKGNEPKTSPFFEKNINIRKGNIVFQLTEDETAEIIKCKRNIIYFIEKYAKVKRPDGKIGNIKLRKYQYNQVKDFLENDEIILGWSRQSGKTVGTALFILWNMLFNYDKQTAILANKAKTSGEVLDKIKSIYKNLPFFLQSGVLGWNESTISFDNDCKIYTAPTTGDALNGRTCNILYIDEFAFVGKGKNKIEYQKDFLANAIPILSSQKNSGLCKLIISSTPLGKEYFYELFDNAMRGKNGMKGSKICWWEIPDKDLNWARLEIAKVGITKFKQQYEMSFNVHSKTLLNAKTMRRLSRVKRKFKTDEYDILSNYIDSLYFKPNIELNTNDIYCLSVDIAEGLGQDYSTIQILRVFGDETENIGFEQIGFFADNFIPIEDFVIVVCELFSTLNPEQSKLLVEYNTYGEYFFKCFDMNEDFDIPSESICKFKRNSESDKLIRGLRTNAKVKKIAVSSFKKLVDSKKLIVESESTIAQIENFQENEKGNYEATIGHDDEVTPLINFSYWVTEAQNEYVSWIDEYLEVNGYDEYVYGEIDDEVDNYDVYEQMDSIRNS